MTKSVDIAIIGSGPAGISAAREAKLLGLKFIVIDEQQKIGGNIYRNFQHNLNSNNELTDALGNDFSKCAQIMSADFLDTENYLSNAQVFSITQDGELAIKQDGEIFIVRAKKILIATGAIERPTPYPGWTLPGVMTVGAAQTMMKDSMAVPNNSFVIAGNGPLVLLLIIQYLKLGVKPEALLLTGPLFGKWTSLTLLLGAFSNTSSMFKGFSWLIKLIFSDIKIYTNVTDIKLEGEKWVDKISFKCKSKKYEIDAEHVFLHEGVVPNTTLAMAADCKHSWSSSQYCWQPEVDEWGKSSAENIYVAGDSAQILGAEIAPITARLAVLSIASELNFLETDDKHKSSRPLLQRIKRELQFRRFIDSSYPPPSQIRGDVSDDTVVCRCENIRASQIRKLAELKCAGINQAKAYTRSGMGLCQGRMCGLTVAEIMAKTQNQKIDEIGYYNVRTPVRPITLGDLATFRTDEEFSMLKMVNIKK